jgi:hypothetical protein
MEILQKTDLLKIPTSNEDWENINGGTLNTIPIHRELNDLSNIEAELAKEYETLVQNAEKK